MIKLVRGLGPRPGVMPRIFAAIPPPLMAPRAYGMNQSVINLLLPNLVPMIAAREHIDTIDVFTWMGGLPPSTLPHCTLETAKTYSPCAWWCDAQSCDQCHPNDNGYAHMAKKFLNGLNLPPPSPRPSPSPSRRDGAWIYEFEGDGKLFVPANNFTRPHRSNHPPRSWDACEDGSRFVFDNGHPLRPGPDGAHRGIGAVSASGSLVLRGWTGCAHSYSYNFTASGAFSAKDGIRYSQFMYLEIDSE